MGRDPNVPRLPYDIFREAVAIGTQRIEDDVRAYRAKDKPLTTDIQAYLSGTLAVANIADDMKRYIISKGYMAASCFLQKGNSSELQKLYADYGIQKSVLSRCIVATDIPSGSYVEQMRLIDNYAGTFVWTPEYTTPLSMQHIRISNSGRPFFSTLMPSHYSTSQWSWVKVLSDINRRINFHTTTELGEYNYCPHVIDAAKELWFADYRNSLETACINAYVSLLCVQNQNAAVLRTMKKLEMVVQSCRLLTVN